MVPISWDHPVYLPCKQLAYTSVSMVAGHTESVVVYSRRNGEVGVFSKASLAVKVSEINSQCVPASRWGTRQQVNVLVTCNSPHFKHDTKYEWQHVAIMVNALENMVQQNFRKGELSWRIVGIQGDDVINRKQQHVDYISTSNSVTDPDIQVTLYSHHQLVAINRYFSYDSNIDVPSFPFLSFWGGCERRGWYDNSQPELRPHSRVAHCSSPHCVCYF